MKRVGDIFESVLDIDNLRLAFLKACRGKRIRADQRMFQSKLDRELIRLQQGLADGTYPVGNYTRFKIFDPKEREICAAAFGERVLHHALINVCEPYFDKWLCERTFACRKGYGQFRAVQAAAYAARRHAWYLKCDFRKFFDTIPHAGIRCLLLRKFKDRRIIHWLERILSTYQTAEGRGLPIGNLTSQHLANLYLDPLDRLARTAYVRYMDDFVFWSNSRDELLQLKRDVLPRLAVKLGLELKEPMLNRTSKGMDFLGMRVFPGCVGINRRSRNRYRQRMRLYDHLLETEQMTERDYQDRVTALTAFVQQADTLRWRQNYFGGRREASGSNRVMRGGSYNNDADNCTSSYRNNNNSPSNDNNNNGFRLACSAAPQEYTAVPVGNQTSLRRGEYTGGSVLVGRPDGHEPLFSFEKDSKMEE